MRRFVHLCILLIGMISLTGFSTTTDLEENPFMISIDVDVGDVILVDNAIFILHTKTQTLEVPYLLIEFDQEPCYKQVIYNQPNLDRLEHFPTANLLEPVQYRPREGVRI